MSAVRHFNGVISSFSVKVAHLQSRSRNGSIPYRGRFDTAGVLSLAYGLAYAKHLSSDGKNAREVIPLNFSLHTSLVVVMLRPMMGRSFIIPHSICRCDGMYTSWSQKPRLERDCVVEHVSGTICGYPKPHIWRIRSLEGHSALTRERLDRYQHPLPADETKALLGGVCGSSTRRFDVIL